MKTMLSALSERGQDGVRYSLTPILSVYTFTNDMGRPRITQQDRRSKLFPLRLSLRETAFFHARLTTWGNPLLRSCAMEECSISK